MTHDPFPPAPGDPGRAPSAPAPAARAAAPVPGPGVAAGAGILAAIARLEAAWDPPRPAIPTTTDGAAPPEATRDAGD